MRLPPHSGMRRRTAAECHYDPAYRSRRPRGKKAGPVGRIRQRQTKVLGEPQRGKQGRCLRAIQAATDSTGSRRYAARRLRRGADVALAARFGGKRSRAVRTVASGRWPAPASRAVTAGEAKPGRK